MSKKVSSESKSLRFWKKIAIYDVRGFTHAQDTTGDAAILHQSPGSSGFIEEKTELAGVLTTLSDPQWKLSILVFDQGFHYLPEWAADHWFVPLGPLARHR